MTPAIPDMLETFPELLVDRVRGRVSWVWSANDDPKCLEAFIIFWNDEKQRLGTIARFMYN